METGYQRSKIQEESIHYETLKHDGPLPIIGVNTFQNPHAEFDEPGAFIELARAMEDEKPSQLMRVNDFIKRHEKEGPEAWRHEVRRESQFMTV
jgi:methylmalonyl-CoA mutase